MELYHIHLMGNYDDLYKEGSELFIDKNLFDNRLYNKISNMNPSVRTDEYQIFSPQMLLLQQNRQEINLGNITDLILENMEEWTKEDLYNYSSSIKQILRNAKTIMLEEEINIREMALEEYRKNNCPLNPSRLHSMFACSKEGLDYWLSKINNEEIQVFRIFTYEMPFVSNENLLPNENTSYGDKLKLAYRYFYPKKEQLNPETNEYLVQGRVKIRERIK